MSKQRQQPYPYSKGDKVRDIHTGKVFIVKLNGYWQNYEGGGDYTVEFEATDEQPTPWNQSRNLVMATEEEEDGNVGVCPACQGKGDFNEGCPTCPGFWYTTEAEATRVNATLEPLPDERQDAT